ncbi:MAG TPA: hypothetical protein VF453_04895 [Burkholderiaceae bacterium]
MDITSSSLAHLGLSSGWSAPSTVGAVDEGAHDPASWFRADASAARIALPAATPEAADVASLARRVLAHLAA